MTPFIRHLSFVICHSILAAACVAQQSPDPTASTFHAGLRASYLENYHHTLDAVCPTCGTYSDGKGSGYAIELFGEVPFNFFRRLDLTFGAGLANRGGDFGDATASNLTVLDPNSGTYVPLVRQSSFSASLNYLNLTGGLRIRPLARFAGYFGASIEAGIPLGKSASYVETEKIISPQGVLYPGTNTTTMTDGSGVIPNIRTSFGVSGTLGYEFPLSPIFTASPEISYYYPLTNVESGFLWKVSSIRAGLAVRWNKPPQYIAPPPPKPEPPPVVQRDDPNALAPKLSAVSLSSAPFHIIETTVTETFPILPYVFFDSASSVLSDRLAHLTPEEANHFKESELPHKSLESYYNILNILGNRLREHPSTMLTINGTTDGREAKDDGKALAQARAITVRDYLVHVWGIAPERLEMTTTDAPNNPSSTEYAEGFEENRRVELSSDDDQLLKPIVHERFREETASPTSLPIQLSAASKIGVRDWHVAMRVGGGNRVGGAHRGAPSVVIYEASGQGSPPATIDWKPTEGQIESLAKSLGPNDSIYCEFDASATNGAQSKKMIGIPANKSINPFELSRLSLIVFDFDQSAINGQNKRMISSFVAKSLYPVSTATITGSTDNLGELKRNEKLSTDRAFHVRDLVFAEKPDARITSTKGIGPSNLLYDNHLPEGRYYCRTVRIEVETPLEAIVNGQ